MSSRATNLQELEAIMERLFARESLQHGLAFRPRPADIIISPFSKSGTTWLQQIAHGLRTRGSMDFEEITEVVPWIEVAHTIGWDLDAPQVAAPRLYKSHLPWDKVPKGGRYICAFRHPYTATVSLYRFLEGWLFEPGTISLEELTRWRWAGREAGRARYLRHLISWWEQRHNPDVLLLCFEDMKADLPGTVRKVAAFMDVELDNELMEIVVRQSSLPFMLTHKYHFDEKYMRRAAERLVGVTPNEASEKVTEGVKSYRLSPALKAEIDAIWRAQVTPGHGLENYEDLRRSLKRDHSQRDAGTIL